MFVDCVRRLKRPQGIQNIFKQSGEWVTILKSKKKTNPFRSLRVLIFVSFLLLSQIIIILFGQLLQGAYNNKTIEEKLLLVQNQCSILGNQILINQFIIESSQDNLNVEIDQLANVWEGRILVIDSKYQIVKDTYTIDQGNYMVYDEVFRVMRGEKDRNVRMVDNYAEIIVPIVNTNKVVNGAMIATVSLQDIEDTNEYIATQVHVLHVLFSLLSIIAAWFIAYISVLGIKRLSRQLAALKEGHLDTIEGVVRFHELTDLTDSFNALIEKMRVLEESRQEFVSNVSHELKTPITSMKVLADSLLMQEEVPNEMYREFMSDMVEEIDRETKIINDLLTLVKMDKKAAELNIEQVNINALLELLLKRIKPLAAKRNIELVFESFREVVGEIDEVKLSLAFSNLIENAVKYNNEGGNVHVSLNADHKFFYVKVQDNGLGIPEDCQSQIFERFYRIDKARSRETGGTGLGLAITRNAILMHKGAIKLYSQPGEGTTFTVRIPLKYIS
ncbi:MAG: two-component sensor histidine kinase [Lachnospiraceae bacterium]|nr:two-component sensor histidine kinase [Lachnospiraceae bacterium]